MKIYQLCQKVKGKDVVIREAHRESSLKYMLKKNKEFFIKEKLSTYLTMKKKSKVQ